MESTGGTSGSTSTAATAMPSPSSSVADNSKVFCSSLFKATNYEFDPSISEEEKRFYLKAYPTVDVVRERKTHCTVCKIHIGTAPVQENGIKMHPILRVTHCNKCHDFYNSGEFSKGEDGSELYCRWCGQGGEVYCCSSCPYVFCKSCIVKNLSKGVVADIEQNENWNCFSCAPKILWPLRAQHWALMNYIEQQKKELYALNLGESELKMNLGKDRSRCCRLAKAKCGNMSDSMESLDSVASKRSHSSSFSSKKPVKLSSTPSPQHMNPAKRAKSNDEVVCTPDLLSMLEPDCQITMPPKPNRPMGTPSASTPKIMSITQPQSGYGSMTSTPKNSVPPPLVLRNTAIKLRPSAPQPVVRRTIIGPRTPNPGGNGTPVYHTINGYRIDLNSAAQQETFRLPNGKLIQVKRQGPPVQNSSPSSNNWQQMSSPQPQRVIPQTIASRAVQITPHPYNISVQQQPAQHPPVVRYHNNIMGSTTVSPVTHNGTTIQLLNGQITPSSQSTQPQQQSAPQSGPVRPVMVRHVFPDNPIGNARTGLQDQVFNAMDICTHLTNKVQTLTNSNAYKQARNYLEVKELYIHLSYLLTYAIGRFKSLQDKCLGDMRTLGFGNDADCLENGQLAADKQASDDEDNEIEIVEPKTDLITLDSDEDEPAATAIVKPQDLLAQNKSQSAQSSPQHGADVKIKPGVASAQASGHAKPSAPSSATTPPTEESMDLMSMAQSFLASMLEVDIQEGPLNSPGSDSSGPKKQPRKKLTNKPNPTLLKQKALMERERLEELKRNDQKLKMKCSVELKKAEDVFPYAKEMLEAKAKEDLDKSNDDEDDRKMDEVDDENKTTEEEPDGIINTSAQNEEENMDNDANEDNETAENNAINPDENNEEEKDDKNKEISMETSGNETSVEVIEDLTDNSAKEIVQCKENNTENGNGTQDEEDSNDTDDGNIISAVEDATSKTVNDVEKNETNGLEIKEKLPEHMDADEGSPNVSKNTPMDVDDNESLQTNEPEADQKQEELHKSQDDSSKEVPDKEVANLDEQNDNCVDKNLSKSMEIINESESSTEKTNCDLEEHPTNIAASEEQNNKEAIEDLPINYEGETENKVLPLTTEGLPNKEHQVAETELKDSPTSSNGNV